MENLARRGVNNGSQVCYLCKSSTESNAHVLFFCSKIITIWKKILSWWSVSFGLVSSLSDLIVGNDLMGNNKVHNEVFKGVIYVSIWAIWNWRNKLTFANDIDREKFIRRTFFPLFNVNLFFGLRIEANARI